MKNNRGMTLVEVLIGNALLIIVILASLSIFKDVATTQIGTENYLNLIVTRNRLISHVLDSRTWDQTVNAAENLALSCLKNQDNPDPTYRNCNGISNQSINLYSLDGQNTFPMQTAGIGIGKTGELCTSYVTPPGTGDPMCPLGINFTVSTQCDAASPNCTNPPLLLQGQFTMNGAANTLVMNTQPFNFSLIGVGYYCPVQDNNVKLVGDAQITTTDTTVTGITAAAQVGHYAQTTPIMFPCRQATLDFTINSFNYSVAQPNNQTTTCIADENTGTCLYSFVHKRLADGTFSFDLLENAVVVATKPSWMNLSGTEIYEFNVLNGMVKFCVDMRCIHFFENKLEGPFRVRFYPAWSNGGIIIDNFTPSFEGL